MSNNATTDNSTAAMNFANMTAMEVYHYYEQQCDSRKNIESAALSTSAYTFLLVYSVSILLQLCILPANWRLTKDQSGFQLLLHINILDILWLVQYTWLSAEFIAGSRLHVPWNLEAYLFRLVNFCIDVMYIELAFNRSMAVLFPFSYQTVYNKRNMNIQIYATWAFGVFYSVYTNWMPERRPFRCLMQLGYFEPTTLIPKALFATLPDTAVYNAIQQAFMVCIYIPMALYIATSIKMAADFMKRTFQDSVVQSKQAVTKLPQTSEEHSQFANLMLERTRLYFICFLSTLPYFLANSLYQTSRILQLDANTVAVMATFWQLFGTIFHVQQPVLMFLLSKDLRHSVCGDFLRIFAFRFHS